MVKSMNKDNAENVNSQRLLQRIADLGAIGSTKEGGVSRLTLTDEDKEGRDYIVGLMELAGMSVRVDKIGNIFGIRNGSEDLPPIMTGSHLDTVRNGGKYDGAYGILAGLETVETLNDFDIETKRPIVVGAFTNEEGARFQPDMMGSLVYAGGLDIDEALNAHDSGGLTLGEELIRINYNGDMPCGDIIPHAFIELHIEQGPILEIEGIGIGAVENLQGISWREIEFTGQANHAGTTPMQGRRDAGYCAASVAVFVRELAKRFGANQVSTVGEMKFIPNVINVVPSRARVTVDLRNTDNEILLQAEQELESFLTHLKSSEGVSIESRVLARFDPITFDQGIVAVIEKKANQLGLNNRRMTSGAGHDAQMMSRICPSAMIFVPSINGISHSPKEHTNAEDLIAGANVLLHTMVEKSNEI